MSHHVRCLQCEGLVIPEPTTNTEACDCEKPQILDGGSR